jgi:peptidylprolyl isomerase
VAVSVALGGGGVLFGGGADAARAIGFQKELKKRGPVAEDAYARTAAFEFRGLPHAPVKYYDEKEGSGKEIEAGALATMHFECKFRGLTVSSTREARTLGGNRTISEPFQLKYGTLPNEFTKAAKRKNIIGVGVEVRIDPELGELYVVKCVFNGPADRAGIQPNDVILAIDGVGDLVNKPIQDIGAMLVGDAGTELELKVQKGGSRNGPGAKVETYKLVREVTAVATPKREVQVDGGGGLFTGGSGPKPPPLIYVPESLAGMKVGGRRKFVVPADVGYEDIGEGEIPPGATFDLYVDLLDVQTST